MISASPAREDWAVIHMIQHILLLPLISNYTTNQIQDMIVDSGFPALVIYEISPKSIINNPLIDKLTFEQSDSYLQKLGWESGSTLVNNFSFIVVLIFVGILNLIVI